MNPPRSSLGVFAGLAGRGAARAGSSSDRPDLRRQVGSRSPQPQGEAGPSGGGPAAGLEIRRLAVADAASYRALRLRCLREHPEAFTSSFEEESLQPLTQAQRRLAPDSSASFWGAFVDGVLVGQVALERERRRKNQHKATVTAMYVAPEFGRRGIARALLKALLAEARARGLELLVLTVTRGNLGAERLYLDLGFVSWGMEPGAIKVQNRRLDKNHMFLELVSA